VVKSGEVTKQILDIASLLTRADETTPCHVAPPDKPWFEMPLLELLPVSRRAEAVAILDRDPAMIDHLRECKRGLIDCWTAMELMGMDPWAE